MEKWEIISQKKFEDTWLQSDSQRIKQGFQIGVKIPGVCTRTEIDNWIKENSIDFKVSYCAYTPSYHTYWFRDLNDAALFLFRWKGKYAKENEGFTKQTCNCDSCNKLYS